jgi:hypothetical protein
LLNISNQIARHGLKPCRTAPPPSSHYSTTSARE